MSSTAKPAAVNTFHVAFRTTSEGYLKTTKITIEEDVMDAMDSARIDLAEHPLYPDLQAYVRNNPR